MPTIPTRLLIVGLVAIVPPAAAEPAPRLHDGFYLRLGVGPSYAAGSLALDGASEGGGGLAVSTELAIGTTIRPGLVVGGGTFPMVVPSASYAGLDAGGHHLSATGPFVDYYLDPRRGLHVQGGLLLAAGYQDDRGDLDSAVGFGFAATAGIGYERWVGEQWSVGPLLRVTYYHWAAETDAGVEETLDLVAPALLVAVTYH